MSQRWWLTSVFVLLLMALGGCSWPFFAAATPPPAPTMPPPVATATSTQTPAPLPTTTPAPTPTPAPIETATPTGALLPCVQPNAQAALPSSLDFAQAMSGAVQQALNAGMPIAALNNALQRAQLGGYPYAAVGGDFDGDHHEDAAVALVDTSCGKHPPQGVLLVFLCQGNRFADPAVFQEPATNLAWGAPTIQFAQDLNADGRTELVVSAAHCDAQGMVCEERYAILAWRDGGLRDLLEGGEGPFASPVPFVEDPDGDGIYDFIVETGSGERLMWHYQGGVWKR